MKRTVGLTFVAVTVVAGFAYLLSVGNTHSWPKVQCRVTSTRVIRSVVERSPGTSALVLYRGQAELQYTVGGKSYYIWTDSEWSDKDKKFVEDKMNNLSERCP